MASAFGRFSESLDHLAPNLRNLTLPARAPSETGTHDGKRATFTPSHGMRSIRPYAASPSTRSCSPPASKAAPSSWGFWAKGGRANLGGQNWVPNLEPWQMEWLTHFPSLRKVENWEAGLPLEAAQAWPVCLPGPGKFCLAPPQDALKPKPTSGCPISTRSFNTMEIPQRYHRDVGQESECKGPEISTGPPCWMVGHTKENGAIVEGDNACVRTL